MPRAAVHPVFSPFSIILAVMAILMARIAIVAESQS
jgi:hypothetical protein